MNKLFDLAADFSDSRITIIDDITIVAEDAEGAEIDWPEDLADELMTGPMPNEVWTETAESKPEWAHYYAYWELADGTSVLLDWLAY